DALDAVHVAGSDRVQRRQFARLTFALETFADRLQHLVRTPQSARRADAEHVAGANECRSLIRRDHLLHWMPPMSISATRTNEPERHASATAMAAASDRTPSSPVAAGSPVPCSAAQNLA